MNKLLLLVCAIGLAGCVTRVSRFDEFEKTKVDKLVGNDVKFHVFSRTLVCLNPMREARWPEPATNQAVVYQTNCVVSSVTNITITTSANQQLAANTNTLPAAPAVVASESASPGSETNPPPPVASPASDALNGGLTISTTRNESIASGPNQAVLSRSTQTVTSLSQQGTVNVNNCIISGATNQMVTVETNIVITTVTNFLITPVTNLTVTSPQQQVYDYYLFTEIAPADFSLQPGESLIVLVDGTRYGLTPTLPQSGWKTRRGYLTTFFKVQPEILEGLANAREVKIRIKGTTGALERKLNVFARQHFRDFLVHHFGPRPEPEVIRTPKNAGIPKPDDSGAAWVERPRDEATRKEGNHSGNARLSGV